jgi:hypothetical protein
MKFCDDMVDDVSRSPHMKVDNAHKSLDVVIPQRMLWLFQVFHCLNYMPFGLIQLEVP